MVSEGLGNWIDPYHHINVFCAKFRLSFANGSPRLIGESRFSIASLKQSLSFRTSTYL